LAGFAVIDYYAIDITLGIVFTIKRSVITRVTFWNHKIRTVCSITILALNQIIISNRTFFRSVLPFITSRRPISAVSLIAKDTLIVQILIVPILAGISWIKVIISIISSKWIVNFIIIFF
jgi:hypothetical protein